MGDLFQRALKIMPGGVSSPVRAFGSVGGEPIFVAEAAGPYLRDTDGRRYIDLVCSWGPALLGHAHPEVIEAVANAAARGLSFGAPTSAEIDLAELVRDRVSPCEKVRFVSTGTEATMTAIRLARGAKSRDVIIKFSGCYHGHSDSLLAAAGSGLATQGLPGSAGVTRGAAKDTIVVPYNDPEALRQVFASSGDRIAAVITEASPANMGVVPPDPGFNALIRELTTAHGALMIIDEVLTGFRVSPGGYWELENAATGRDAGYQPDLFTFGKVLGGGMPLAALGGPAELMDLLAPLGPVYQAGTLSGNPLATAAGIKTLQLADEDVYAHINRVAGILSAAIDDALSAESVPHQVQRAGSLFSVFFTADQVKNYAGAQAQDTAAFAAFFHALLDQGVAIPPSAFEAWFVSSTHTDEVIDQVISALPRAARAAAAVQSG